MPFSSIFGHSQVIERLDQAFKRDHLPSAYLFTGPAGLGKGVVARALAQMLNCTTHNNCGHCPACGLFQRKEHPDFIIVRPQGKFIKIAQIKDLIQNLSLRPTYAKKRVVLLKHVHHMNMESANAFLKILEEPPLDTLLILTAHDESLLLETILSRCQRMPFAPLEPGQVDAILKKDFRLAEDCISLVMAYSEGRLRREFIEQANKLLSIRSQALHMISNLTGPEMGGHYKQIESILQQKLEPYFLEFLSHLLKDILLLQLGMTPQATNQDLLNELTPLAERFSPDKLERAFGRVIRTEENILTYASRPLAMEAMMVELKWELGA